jgi:L-lactate dehydrogenase complex protein LldE
MLARRVHRGNSISVRVGLFVTCLGDTLFPSTGQAVVRLLERLGHEVEFPEDQTCCGQMHLNSGFADEGLSLARRLAGVFEGHEAVVTPSASCAGMVREQLGDDSPPLYELSEFLVDVLAVDDVGAYYPHRVTYHPTCHSLRALRVGEKPQRLLRAVRGLDLVELPDALECCGFGGTFAVKNADVSTAMLSDKVRDVLDTQAEVVCAVDSSCLMHIGGGLARGQTGVRTVHLAEVLASTEEEQWP